MKNICKNLCTKMAGMCKCCKNKHSWMALPIIILLVLSLMCLVFYSPFNYFATKNATKKALDFVTSQVSKMNPKAKVVVVSTKAYHGLIEMNIDIDGEKMPVYVTRDGKVVFPQAIPLEPEKETVSKIKKTDKVDVKLFTMAYCPFGNEAEEAIIPVQKLLASAVKVEPHYVIYSNYPSPDQVADYCLNADGKYCSMHGLQELRQDVRELCIWKYEEAKYWDYIKAVNADCTVDNINTCWKTPAKALAINTDKITTCLATEAETILKAEKELNDKYSVQGSPMLLINETEYSGDRTAEGYKNGICNAFKKKPAACSQKLGTDNTKTNTPAASCGN